MWTSVCFSQLFLLHNCVTPREQANSMFTYYTQVNLKNSKESHSESSWAYNYSKLLRKYSVSSGRRSLWFDTVHLDFKSVMLALKSIQFGRCSFWRGIFQSTTNAQCCNDWSNFWNEMIPLRKGGRAVWPHVGVLWMKAIFSSTSSLTTEVPSSFHATHNKMMRFYAQ